MKLLSMLILSTGFTIALADETPSNLPSVDHSAIFQHSNQTTLDTTSMTQAEVVSVVNTKGYTYIEVAKEDNPIWLAVPSTEVKMGDTVHYTDGPVVNNYVSRTLGKTFPSVIFLLSVVVNSKS